MQQFNRHAAAYNAIRHKIRYPQALYDSLASRTPERQAALDIGCGNGVSTAPLAALFSQVEGCDIGDAMIAKARQNYPDIHFTVCDAACFTPNQPYDLVTSATSFYWMDRPKILAHLARWLKPDALFCAWKYDFPLVYGPLQDFIGRELVTRWAAWRDSRLTHYDDTLELMQACPHLCNARREVFANILFLTPLEVALFFLSTSYVTRYIEEQGGEAWAQNFTKTVQEIETAPLVAVNFDIHAFSAHRRRDCVR